MIVLLIEKGTKTDVGTKDGEDDGDIIYTLDYLGAEMWIRDRAKGDTPKYLRARFED
jgi:hypothetical protein